MSKYYSSSIAFGANQTKTEKVVVSPTKIGDVTTDAVSGALTVDEVPTLDSLNPVSSDGVARAVIQAGAELPTRGSSDTGKVLTVKNSDGDLEWDEPATVTVDQTYDATSTNAQSGVAVAEAIAAIPAPSVDEVPAVTSTDDGKVLTASYSGGVGSYSWETAQGGGGSSYTASAPIVIQNDDIKLKYTNNFALNWQWQPELVTGFDTVTPDMSYAGLVTKCKVSSFSSSYSPFNSNYKFVLTVHGWSNPASIYTSDTTTKWTIVLYKSGSPTTDYAIATETYEYASVSGNNHYLFDGSDSSFTFTFATANIHGWGLSNTPLCLAFLPDPADNVTGTSYWNTTLADLDNTGYSVFLTSTGPVANALAPTPGATPKDSLTIASLPDTVVDQTFKATSTKAQSGKAVASAVNTGVAAAIDDAVDVDTSNVVLSGDGDSIKIEFTRVTDTSTTIIEHTNLTGTTNTAQAYSWWYCNLVFDLEDVNKAIDAGSDPILKITSPLTVYSPANSRPSQLGFSNNTTSISNVNFVGYIYQSPVRAENVYIKSKVSNASYNSLRYLVVQFPAPSNTEESAQELATAVASSVSIEGWPVDAYGTKAVIPNLPAYSDADAGRVLQVQADGTLAWVTLS